MVFANLGPHEKDAFFSLLDEYFASRPEILTKGNNNDGGQAAAALAASSSAAAANAVRNAVVKRPEQAAKYVTAGLKHFAGSGGTNAHGNNNNDSRLGTPSGSGSGGHNSNKGTTGGQGESAEEEPPSMAGRIAAAQAMFSGKHNPFSKHLKDSNPSSPPPPPLSSSISSPPPAPATSSFLKATSGFAPPPVRRTASNTVPSRLPPPPSSPPPEEDEQGEWVEVLYDYESDVKGDLNVKVGQRILLIERTSDDWWTGELNGNKGLFPASYVKIL